MRSLFLSAAIGLIAAAGATAQPPPPAATPVIVGGTVVSGPVLVEMPAKVTCLPGKCDRPPCTPETKSAKKTVYTTVTREFCVPSRSLFDVILAKCGMADDCDGPSGETRTKTLLVKKQVPKCVEACETCKTTLAPAPTMSVPVVPAKP